MSNKQKLFLYSLGIYFTYRIIDNSLSKGYSVSFSKGDLYLNLTPPDTSQLKVFMNPLADI